MRLMFDIEFNMGYLLATLLTGLLLTGLIVHSQPKRPMRPPDAVINLSDSSDTESETSSGETIGEDEVDGIYKEHPTNINKG